MTSNRRQRQFNQISERIGRQIKIKNEERLVISLSVRLMSLLVKSAWTHKYVCKESAVDSRVHVNAAHLVQHAFD